MSDFSYERAINRGLIQHMTPPAKEMFKEEVRKELGVPADQDCDKVCSQLTDEQFKAMIDRIREKIKKRLMGKSDSQSEGKKEVVQMYA